MGSNNRPMLYYWLHLVYVYLASRFIWKSIPLDKDHTRSRIVSMFDCEAFRYMANSRYFYYMDLIRFEVVFRSSLYAHTIKKGMTGVLASQKIIYKKPLKMWKRFEITLQLDGSDEKWVYHRQIFKQGGQVCAIGFTKAGFWKNKKAQNMRQILIDSGVEDKIRQPSAEMRSLFENDYQFIKQTT